MAKKVDASFKAEIIKNTEKGGAWTATYTLTTDGEERGYVTTAWSNASACKRWIKERVIERTPRKSIKWVDSGRVDEKGKPVCFTGELVFKVEA
jgi:heme-degrading monooxygenase HmoA